jgi:pyruvate-formate lyase-activating enzyme
MYESCRMLEQGEDHGACLVEGTGGEERPACELTLRIEGGIPRRRIESIHLSRPEHYLSVYQSGCNLSCRKCHSAEFSKRASGDWYSPEDILREARRYANRVTWWEPRERATMYHAEDLCRSCGHCVTGRERSPLCPGVLEPDRIVPSPQGVGPARNIVAFTGGDLTCRPEFYAEVARLLRRDLPELHLLVETNGFGLTDSTLEALKAAGVTSFWLDIKAWDDEAHTALTGVPGRRIRGLPAKLTALGFVYEVLTLYIPTLVETDQIAKIAARVAAADPEVPFTLLAFFPCHRLGHLRGPTFPEMLHAWRAVRTEGLRHVRLGNLGVFLRTQAQLEILTAEGAI